LFGVPDQPRATRQITPRQEATSSRITPAPAPAETQARAALCRLPQLRSAKRSDFDVAGFQPVLPQQILAPNHRL